MATNKHFHIKHGLTVGSGVDNSGTATREVITNTGQLVDVGALNSLTTTDKTNAVAAINEVKTLASNASTVDDIIALAIALG
ncbi:virion structural protein [Cyanophage S-TIM66]|nr:virion structural protein [Cyanophage S-TIM66]